MCVFDVPAAHAGQWEIVPLNWQMPNYQAEILRRFPSRIESEEYSPPNGGLYPTPPVDTGRHTLSEVGPIGGQGKVSYNGPLKVVLRYRPSSTTDVPTGKIYLKVQVIPIAWAQDGNPFASSPKQTRVPSREHISVTITPGGDANANAITLNENTRGSSDYRYGMETAPFYLQVEPDLDANNEMLVTVSNLALESRLDNFRVTVNLAGQPHYGAPSTPVVTWNDGHVVGNFYLKSELTSYFSFISSDIETSWKKGTGALPEIYTKLGADGTPRYGSQQVAGQNTPNDASDDVWKLECIQGSDGSMTVESAATWNFENVFTPEGESSPTYFWYGSGVFTAHHTGFNSPTYSWKVNANTGVEDGDTLTLIDYTSSNPFGPRRLDLGTGRHLPTRSSAIAVTVTDPMVSITGHYSVNWHEPLENPIKGEQLDAHTNYDTSASSWTPINTPITVTVEPANIAWSLLGGGIALGGAGTAFVGSPVGAVVGLALTAAGLVLSESAPQDITFTRTFNYGDYADAIGREYSIQTGQTSSDDNHWRIAGLDVSELQDAYNGLTDAGNVTGDPFYSAHSGSIQGRIAVARPWEKNEWKGDIYNKNGFSGVADYNLEQEQAPIYVSLVSFFGDTQPMPRPTATPTPTSTPTPTPSPL